MEKNQEQKKKKHYNWWPNIRDAVQAYPSRIGADLSGVALHEQEAVEAAIEATERMENGQNRLKVIRLVHFEKTHKILGASLAIPCGEATANRWQKRFFEEVARNRDLLD